ncbi:MAG: hypothetical protein R3A52_10750 [Polyangiales bacterium]
MSRPLAMIIEPSDALLGLLRMKAAAEAGRWPLDLSMRLRGTVEAEVQRIGELVEAVGVCIQHLEAHGVARVDRRPQSRFSDVDGALHLMACAFEVNVDLDNLKLALERGDGPTREGAQHLAASARKLLWALVRSDLLNCPRLLLSGVEQPPDRALRFFDAYLSRAWNGAGLPELPLPRRDRGPGSLRPPASLAPEPGEVVLPLVTPAMPPVDPAAVFDPPLHAGGGSVEDLAAAATVNTEVGAMALGVDRTPYPLRSPLRRTPRPDPWADVADRETLTQDQIRIERHAPLADLTDSLGGSTVQIRTSDILSEDARFFILASGVKWPCDQAALDAARARLFESTETPPDGVEDPSVTLSRQRRLDRGYDELYLLSSRPH